MIALICFTTGFFLLSTAGSNLFIAALNNFFSLSLDHGFWTFGLQHAGIELLLFGALITSSFFIHDKPKLALAGTVSFILLFFVFLIIYTVNIPITDDYRSVLHFANQYFSTENIIDKWNLLFAFHSESRFFTLRMTLVLQEAMTGTVNIKTLAIVSNVCLVAITWLFGKSILITRTRLLVTLILTLLLFQFVYYDAIVWATNAFVYQITVLTLMITLFLVKGTSYGRQCAGFFTAMICALTFGNGLLVFPVVILFLIIERNYKTAAAWSVFALIFITIYFTNFTAKQQALTVHPVSDYFTYSVCFLGSAFQFMYKLNIPFATGILILVTFVYLTAIRYFRINFIIYGVLLFAILSSLIAAHFRLHMGVPESISNRYAFFSLLAICCVIVALSETLFIKNQKTFLRPILVFSAIYHLMSGIFFFPEVPIRKQKLEIFIHNIKNEGEFLPVKPIIPPGSDKIVNEAIQKNHYRP